MAAGHTGHQALDRICHGWSVSLHGTLAGQHRTDQIQTWHGVQIPASSSWRKLCAPAMQLEAGQRRWCRPWRRPQSYQGTLNTE